jgi:spore maturation protein CgeB
MQRFSANISFVGKLYQKEASSFYQKTSQNRITMLQKISNQFSVKLYSPYNTDTSPLPNVILQGPVEYYTEMPLVFRLSKINLNLTLSSIRSGIPLRILDILGAGGFLLTNYQPELKQHFTDGQDLVIYHDFEDLSSKIEYYLSHEDERRQIALSGQQKVKLYYNYPDKIQKMFAMAGLVQPHGSF